MKDSDKTKEERVAEVDKSTILNSITELVAYQDRELRVIWANKAAASAVGKTVEQLIGKHCYEIWPQRTTPCVGCPLLEVLKSGKPESGEMTTPDGKMWLISGYPVRDKKDNLVGTIEITLDITERKQAEEALTNQTVRQRVLIKQSRDGIVILDQSGKVYEANRKFADMLGFPPEEVSQLHVWDWETQFTREQVCDMLRSVDEAGDHFETQHRRKDGTIYDVEISTNGAVFAGQKLIFCVCRDITERKQAEEALKSEKAKLQTLMDGLASTQIGIDIVGFDYKVQFQNQFLEAEFGDLTGKLCYENYMGLDKPCDPCPMREAIKTNRLESIELTAVAGRHYKLLSAALPNPDGTVDKAIEVVTDITERKQAEEALRDSEKKYRTLVDNASVGITITQDGMIKFINDHDVETSGYSREELLSMQFIDVVHPDDREMVIDNYLKRLKGEDAPQIYTVRTIDKKGNTKWFEANTVLTTWEGKPAGLTFNVDITEQKKAEAEKQELEGKAQVASRLASVGEMASGIAHEINNPLTGVVGFSELLMTKDLPEDIRKDVEIIHDGSQRVADIVKGLLTFARQHKPERTYTDINEIIESTLALRKYALETGNIEVNTSLDVELPWTMADSGQLQQVFMNIIVNAETEMRKAHGRGKLTIKTEQIGNKIRLSFADDGPGIARENLEKVFDPFFTTREVGEGTGLGLSLSYGIIAEHKGALYAESEPGKGATFIIELPIVAEEEEKIERVEAVEEDGKAPGGRILVLDDEPTILAFLKRVLGSEGYDVETVSSGREALGMIKNKRYGLILCDIKLPGLSGVELYEQIEKVAPSLQKRVMFITGDVTSADTGEFLKKTKAPYVTKPFDIAKLKTEVKRVIAGAG